MRILLVDDSGTMRTIQRRCLEKMGIADIVDAADGIQALELFEHAQFDLIMSDWKMPNMDGMALLKAIRARDGKVPFLMVTTEAERARVVAAIEAGVSDYLVKPFTPDGLRVKLEKWMSVEA